MNDKINEWLRKVDNELTEKREEYLRQLLEEHDMTVEQLVEWFDIETSNVTLETIYDTMGDDRRIRFTQEIKITPRMHRVVSSSDTGPDSP